MEMQRSMDSVWDRLKGLPEGTVRAPIGPLAADYAVVSVHLFIPGCLPHLVTVLDGLSRLLGRAD